VKVEKVLETTSIKEYNQWVSKNKTKYSGLKPFYLKSETIKWGKEYKVYYYDEDGNLRKQELIKARPGKWLSMNTSPYDGIIVLAESEDSHEAEPFGKHTIKDRLGRELCSFDWGFDEASTAGVRPLPGGIGILRTKSYPSNSYSCYAELLTWDGKIFGRIENLCHINIGSKATPNKRFMVLNSEFTAILVEDGKELWRKSFPSGIEVGISDDGQYVAIGDAGTVYVYNRNGDSLYSFCFSHIMSNPRPIFSPDDKYLIVLASGELALIDNANGKLIWKVKTEAGKPLSCVANKYIILIGSNKCYIYDFGGNLLTTIEEEQPKNWETNGDLLLIDIRDKTDLHKVVYRLK
jgi:hypothetical protein